LAKLKQQISAWDERDLKEILKEIVQYEGQIRNLD
jgi:hypothetical protein